MPIGGAGLRFVISRSCISSCTPKPPGNMKAVTRPTFATLHHQQPSKPNRRAALRCKRYGRTLLCFLLLTLVYQSEAFEEEADKLSTSSSGSPVNDLKWKTGIWGSWSSWSSCSRTCGRGVSTQTRECVQGSGYLRHRRLRHNRFHNNRSGTDDKRCLGVYRRFQLCESQPCPSTVDLRREQCAAFNKKPFMGQTYKWEPYQRETDSCELQCRPVGQAFYATLAKVVEDGTSCSTSPTDDRICVAGQCKVIGCDRVIGSSRRLDQCGTCGGNNSTCRRVTGLYSRAPLPLGYNSITKIPAGAFNINVTETNRGRNYLALRLEEGDYIINGNWSFSRSGTYRAAGTIFTYNRLDGNGYSLSGESISAKGPTTHTVELMLVYQNRNPVVYYAYSLPLKKTNSRGEAPANGNYPSRRDTSRHVLKESNDVTRYRAPLPGPLKRTQNYHRNRIRNKSHSIPTIAATTQSRSVDEKPQPSSVRYDPLSSWSVKVESLSPPSPITVEVLNDVEAKSNSPAKFLWKVAGFKPCTKTCGGGISQAEVKCFSNDRSTIVSDELCIGSPKLIGPSLTCNKSPCEPSWITGTWSSCSITCGRGKKIRKVTCSKRLSSSATMEVPEEMCSGVKPSETVECNEQCTKWHTSDWSQCTANCGKGQRHRKVYCMGESNDVTDDVDCPDPKPASDETCFVKACDESQWMTTEWQECPDLCSPGNQSRKVACLNGQQKVSHEMCDRNDRPKDIRPCTDNVIISKLKKCQKGTWFAADWAKCSASCGPGSQTRDVLCLRVSKTGQWEKTEDGHCDPLDKPVVKQKCASKPCDSGEWYVGEWSTCTKSCGTGDQSRSLVCVGPEGENCDDEVKPSTVQSCNTHPCPDSLQGDYSSGSIQINPDPGCTNKWSNCHLAVQARLCRTQHYRDICCLACTKQRQRTVRRLRLPHS